MKRSSLLGRLLLVCLIVFPLAACSSGMDSGSMKTSRTRMSSKKICEAAGGTYVGKTCNPGSSRSAEAMCQAQGGIYLAGEDNCDVPVSQ